MSESNSKKETNTHFQKETEKRRIRTVIRKDELALLEEVYYTNQWPSKEEKIRLSDQLGKTQQFVNIWFQNKRARVKKEKQMCTGICRDVNARKMAMESENRPTSCLNYATSKKTRCYLWATPPTALVDPSNAQTSANSGKLDLEEVERKPEIAEQEKRELHKSKTTVVVETATKKKGPPKISGIDTDIKDENSTDVSSFCDYHHSLSIEESGSTISSIEPEKCGSTYVQEGTGSKKIFVAENSNSRSTKKENSSPIPLENFILFKRLIAMAASCEGVSDETSSDFTAMGIDESHVKLGDTTITYDRNKGFEFNS
ncbi:uncharacterized protein LOC141915386 [Tubulanus polymorphus]|uniref:uncharacterized protein LOC141915386 n=1 Tax=Tubulanus polymorphus TaxID=672921 RepID=UPI003DA48CD1